jgi:hypothetical protein
MTEKNWIDRYFERTPARLRAVPVVHIHALGNDLSDGNRHRGVTGQQYTLHPILI